MRAARSAPRSMPTASIFGNPDRDVPDHPFWGPAVDGQELARAAREDDQVVEELDDAALIERVADELAAGRIVGWMDGASEFGPRALGHRSILAAPHSRRDARPPQSRHQVPRGVPAVRAGRCPVEAADRYFDLPPGGARLARFMSGVFPVRPEWRARLAAVTHVDGSARLQTLERDMAPRLHALLEAYGRRTGIPVLLNTSFNVAGEPIVNRALEGYSTFRRCGIDVLVAGPTLVTKRARPPASRAAGGCRMIKKRGGMRRRLIVLGSAGGIDRGSRARAVAKRLRQALARAAGRLSLPVRPGADSGDDGRSAGAVHLRDFLNVDAFRELLACPACAGDALGGLVVPRLRPPFAAPDGIPDLRLAADERTEAVRRFYERAPFPGYPPRDSLHALHARAERSAFARLLDQAIPGDARIVDVGCGTGQMCLYLARADRRRRSAPT